MLLKWPLKIWETHQVLLVLLSLKFSPLRIDLPCSQYYFIHCTSLTKHTHAHTYVAYPVISRTLSQQLGTTWPSNDTLAHGQNSGLWHLLVRVFPPKKACLVGFFYKPHIPTHISQMHGLKVKHLRCTIDLCVFDTFLNLLNIREELVFYIYLQNVYRIIYF